jgi:hypothetical protein
LNDATTILQKIATDYAGTKADCARRSRWRGWNAPPAIGQVRRRV